MRPRLKLSQTLVHRHAPVAQRSWSNCVALRQPLCQPTSHGIHGITENSLTILGALLLQITAGGQQTNQVVHVAKNIKGFYLSQTAMKDLNLIPSTFPHTSTTIKAVKTPGPEKAPCGCPLCTEPPPHPQQAPKSNLPRLHKELSMVRPLKEHRYAVAREHPAQNVPCHRRCMDNTIILLKKDLSQPPDLPEVLRGEGACRVEHTVSYVVSCCHLV